MTKLPPTIPPPSLAQEFGAGVRAIMPLELAGIPFGMLLGAASIQQGLDASEAVLMSAVVFAGSAQFVAVGLWRTPAPWLELGFAVFLINLRYVLMGASLVLKMERFTPWQRWLAAFVFSDEGWAICEQRALAAPLTPSFYAGVGATMYCVWLTSTAAGTVLGGYVPNPGTFGLDFAFPAVFLCLVVSFGRNWRAVPVITASAVTAFVVQRTAGGMWFVIAGGLAGMAVAAALPSPPEVRQ